MARLLSLSVVLLALLASATTSKYTQEICFTSLGSTKPATVPTTTKAATLTIPVTVKSTFVPTSNVTLPASTLTSTVLSIATSVSTLSQQTDTFSTTTTFFSTETDTTTIVTTLSTSTDTTTTLDTTSTVPTAAGFTPLASIAVADGGNPSKRKRNALEPRGGIQKLGTRSKPSPNNFIRPLDGKSRPAQYPTRVVCDELVEVVPTSTKVITATKTATSTVSPPVSTFSTTVTITSVSTTMLQDASTTTTFSTTSSVTTTSVISSTSTVTSTNTVTAYNPVATVYDACQSNNLITNFSPGQTITNGYGSYGYARSSATDATDCCSQCQSAGANCGGFFYYPGNCVFFNTGGVCDATQSPGYLVTNDGNAPATVGNSNCGQLRFFS